MNRRRKLRRERILAVAVGESRRRWLHVITTEPQYWKDEIIVDNFAGGGGASTGIELATGRSVDVAINHSPAAVAMHIANHPMTRHYCEDVWAVDPRTVMPEKRVGLVWFSPDCTHHSKARGGKPKEKKIRGLAWVTLRWAATRRPRVIMLENVEEFQTWGPLDKDGQPIKSQAGRTFRTFVNALRRQGYVVEWRELRACDYGAPTIRKRFFLIARCDGQAIVWPQPTHGNPTTLRVINGRGGLKPWRTAAECIDWSIPVPSIFGRKKPLADNTLRRIARGLVKFVMNNPKPFIMKVNHSSDDFRGQSMDEPFQTITAKNGWAVVTPYITRIGQTGFGGDRLSYTLNDPLTTITTKNEHMLITPVLAVNTTGSAGSTLDKPLKTITTGNHHMLIAPTLVKHYGGNYRGAGSSIDEPLHTITTSDHNALVTAFLTQYHTETNARSVRGQSLEGPLLTQDTSNRFGIVTANLIKFRGQNIGQRVDDQLRTVTADGNHHSIVYAFLTAYYGASIGQALDSPLGTVPTHDRFGLVLVKIDGVLYEIVDIGMRMLEPHELYAAQGFPSNYIISGYKVDGRRVSKAEQVARCGNSVPPVFAKALVRSNLPEHCTGSGNKLVFERYKEETGQLQLTM